MQRRLFAVLAILLGLALLPAATQARSVGTPVTARAALDRKIILDARNIATRAELARAGATLLVDYGAFSLWRVARDTAARPAVVALLNRASVAAADDLDTIWLRGGPIDTRGGMPVQPAGSSQLAIQGSRLWLLQFIGPVKDHWLAEVRAAGLEIVQYVPNNAYVVWGDPARLAGLAAPIGWTGAYHPAYRLEPSLQRAAVERVASTPVDVTVQFYVTSALDQSLVRLRGLGGRVYGGPERVLNFANISLQVPAGQLAALAGWADVYNIEPYIAPRMRDEKQGQILAGNLATIGGKTVPSGPGYLAWLASKGFPTTPASYPIVDIVDDGIDQGDVSNLLHPDFHELGVAANPDRVVAITNCTADPKGNSIGGHGNINAGIFGAYNDRSGEPYADPNGYRVGLGISPYGRIAGTKVFRSGLTFDLSGCGDTHQGSVALSYAHGAAITSNSWGAKVAGVYDSRSQAYDALTRDASATAPGNQEMLHIFAAGNQGGSQTINSPATAKNVLAVGASEGVRDNGTYDGCTDAADNADDIATFSSRGPTLDGRIKPDIMAPGTHIQGPASQDPAYDATGVCPFIGYYPWGQTLYTWSSGTSHATPAVAGAAALLYEYYGRILNPGRTPSPAMLKALLLNTPRYLTGVGANDTLPSPQQGWGGTNLGTLFDGTPRLLEDQGHLLRATGETYVKTGMVAATGQPFHVSLVWTDAPGNTTGNAYVNNLDLEVSIGGATYRGNVFSGAHSTTGGAFDPRNNAENVFLPAGVSGPFSVRVIAANIAGDGLPGNGDSTDQDFALVIYNGEELQGRISGVVRDASSGAPIPSAQVQVRQSSAVIAQLTTDAAGRYEAQGLAPGAYDLTAMADGYSTQASAGVSVAAGATTIQDFSLARLAAAQLLASPDSLAVELKPGATITRSLTLSNPGMSPVFFELQAISTTQDGPDIPWLSVSASNGIIPAGGTQTLTLTFDATGLRGRTYSGEIRIGGDASYQLRIPVTLQVGSHWVYLPMVLSRNRD